MVTSLCRPALSDEAFVAPATAREIAADLVVTEAAVKQHLLRLYPKLRIPEGLNRRVRLANEVVALGLVRPLPPTERPDQLAATGNLPAVAGPAGAVRRGAGRASAGPRNCGTAGAATRCPRMNGPPVLSQRPRAQLSRRQRQLAAG